MKIRDIVELAAVLMDKHDIINTGIFALSEENEWIGVELKRNSDLNLLIKCANLTIKEIACEYIPLTYTQKVFARDDRVEYGELEKSILTVVEIHPECSSYDICPEYISLTEGTYEILYNYIPDDKGFFEEIDYSPNEITERILVYGTVSEYCFKKGLYEDALMWEKRYKDALTVLLKEKYNKKKIVKSLRRY